jgi:DNA-binding LytR/AlgR family response regulator
MKINIIHDPQIQEPQITVTYGYLTEELRELLAEISLADNRIAGEKNGETHFLNLHDLYYMETVDGRVFLYTAKDSFETKTRIYQLEEKLSGTPFARVSKSSIVNLRKVRCIAPEKHSKLCMTLLNGEKILVSRQYLGEIKERLGV